MIKTKIVFAFMPVKTDNGWQWLKYVEKTIDEKPVYYLGLLPEISYKSLTKQQ